MKLILLVEDALDLAQIILRELKAEGYNTCHATDGLTAVQLHASKNPDLVILDWMLPKMDGLAVMRHLREYSATPILMLTARGEETDKIIGLELGADDYLTKPFSMRELMARIRALLRRTELIEKAIQADRKSDKDEIAYSDIVLNQSAFTVTLHEQPLELSRTEFSLLSLLMRNPGRAFSREYLLDTIWGESYFGGDRSVDNCVMRLRRKIGKLGDAIETVWGIGYRLKPEN